MPGITDRGREMFGHRIASIRTSMGMNQIQFAKYLSDKSGIRIIESNVRVYEARTVRSSFSMDFLIAIQRAEIAKHLDGTPYTHDDWFSLIQGKEPDIPLALSRFLWDWLYAFWDKPLQEFVATIAQFGLPPDRLKGLLSGGLSPTDEDIKILSKVIVDPIAQTPYTTRVWKTILRGEISVQILHPPETKKEQPMELNSSIGDCMKYWREAPKPNWHPDAEGADAEAEQSQPWTIQMLADIINREFNQQLNPVTAEEIETLERKNTASDRLFIFLSSLEIFRPLGGGEPFDNVELQRIAEGRLDWRSGDVCANPASRDNCPTP